MTSSTIHFGQVYTRTTEVNQCRHTKYNMIYRNNDLTEDLRVSDQGVFGLPLQWERLANICPIAHGCKQTARKSMLCSNSSHSPTRKKINKPVTRISWISCYVNNMDIITAWFVGIHTMIMYNYTMNEQQKKTKKKTF